MFLSNVLNESSTSVLCYFLLNLFVTYTNKRILGKISQTHIQRPYLLTALHGIATCMGCVVFQWFSKPITRDSPVLHSEVKRQACSLSLQQHIGLIIFSLFYTVNIALSNLSLALIDLPSNQTIRATAPFLTVIVSVFFLGRSLQTYSISTCLSLLPIVLGVVVAASSPETISRQRISIDSVLQYEEEGFYGHRTIGILITLLGALTAVLKTILTHKLMTSLSLNLSALQLLQILSPYAAIQAFSFACFSGECGTHVSRSLSNELSNIRSNPPIQTIRQDADIMLPMLTKRHNMSHMASLTLWITNAVAAFLLNIASFEANKRNGPVSMAVAANLKQVAILAVPLVSTSVGITTIEDEKITKEIIIGTVLTVGGGIWYAWSTARDKNKQAMLRTLTESRKSPE